MPTNRIIKITNAVFPPVLRLATGRAPGFATGCDTGLAPGLAPGLAVGFDTVLAATLDLGFGADLPFFPLLLINLIFPTSSTYSIRFFYIVQRNCIVVVNKSP